MPKIQRLTFNYEFDSLCTDRAWSLILSTTEDGLRIKIPKCGNSPDNSCIRQEKAIAQSVAHKKHLSS